MDNQSLIEQYKEIKNQLSSKVLEVIYGIAKRELFDKHSEPNAVVFCMYTPYFNDGEPCENGFGDFVYLNSTDEQLLELEVADILNFDVPEEQLVSGSVGKAFEQQMEALEYILLSGLGTNVSIVVTRSGKYFKDDFGDLGA